MKKLIVTMVLCLSIIACKMPAFDAKSTMETSTDFPFASNAELSSLPNDERLVNWELARKLLLAEAYSAIFSMTGWESCDVAEKPIVIYDGNYLPRYFEYIVYKDDFPIGTLVASARKMESAGVYQYALPYVRDYTISSRSIDKIRYVSVNYPNVIEEIDEDIFSNRDLSNQSNIESDPFPDDQMTILSSLSDELLLGIGIASTREQTLQILEAEWKLNQTEAQEFWGLISEYEQDILLLTDELIKKEYQVTSSRNTGTGKISETPPNTDIYLIPSYGYNTSNDATTKIWGGWCGPSALAHVYRGINSTYGGVPLSNSYNFITESMKNNNFSGTRLKEELQSIRYQDGGLYYDLCDKTGCLLTGSWTLATSFNGAISYVTGDSYGISITASATSAAQKIRNTGLPCVWWVKASHYCTIIGSGNYTTPIKFFGKIIGYNKKINFFIYDNGYLTSINSNSRPYWVLSSAGLAGYYNCYRK